MSTHGGSPSGSGHAPASVPPPSAPAAALAEVRAWSQFAVDRDELTLADLEEGTSQQQLQRRHQQKAARTSAGQAPAGDPPKRHLRTRQRRKSAEGQASGEGSSLLTVVGPLEQRAAAPTLRSYFHWRRLIGTQPEWDKVLSRAHWWTGHPLLSTLLTFVDSVLRGIAQVMFCNNALTGVVILVGLLIGDWRLALYGVLGTATSTATAQMLGLSYPAIRAGQPDQPPDEAKRGGRQAGGAMAGICRCSCSCS